MAEDEPVNRKLAALLLEKRGCRVALTADGVEALAAVRRAEAAGAPFDLVLMDCHMPAMDGCEAAREIRRQETGRRLPVVALTAGVMDEERERCFAAGMDDFLPKPLTPDALYGAVERWGRR